MKLKHGYCEGNKCREPNKDLKEALKCQTEIKKAAVLPKLFRKIKSFMGSELWIGFITTIQYICSGF